MHLRIVLTPSETATYRAGDSAARRHLMARLFAHAAKLALSDGNPVDIIAADGALLDTID